MLSEPVQRNGFEWFETADLDLLEQLSLEDGWQETRYTQFGSGSLALRYGVRPLGSGAVHIETFNKAVYVRGCPPAGMLSVGMVLQAEGRCQYGGHDLEPGQLTIMHDSLEISFASGGPCRVLFFDIPIERLHEAARDSLREHYRDPSARVLTSNPEAARRLRRYAAALASESSRDMDFELEPVVVAEIAALTTPTPERDLALNRRTRLVRRAQEFIEAHLSEPLRIDDLCAILGTTYRTLHRCFQETLGLSPLQYVKALRLRRVHSALRSSDPAAATVTNLAHDHGFGHLGRFSHEYRRMFGEAPSLTLQSR
jgi:AraC family ethanolamine operon transcriptional activator